jgi:hypothetical protein
MLRDSVAASAGCPRRLPAARIGAALLAALGLGFAFGPGLARPPSPAPPAAPVAGLASVNAPLLAAAMLRPPPLLVRLRGDAGAPAERTRAALARVLATRVGARARLLLESGWLPGPITIEVNHHGDHFTRYRVPGGELGETIVFDPDALPWVDTEAGLLRALPETVLAHELGHAVFKLVSEEAVIRAIENPVREDLGLPRRLHF